MVKAGGKKVLVIADLHMGFETELAKSGIRIPFQTRKLLREVKHLLEESCAEKIIILGDVKHSISGAEVEEKREIRKFLSALSNECEEIIITKGNHDGGIEKILRGFEERVKIFDSRGVLLQNLAFAHGHAWIGERLTKAKYLFLGHEHPAIEFCDISGKRYIHACWVIAEVKRKKCREIFGENCKLKKVIFLPAFNTLLGGNALNTTNFTLLTPNAKFIDLENSEIYLEDGTYLGKLKNLYVI